MNPETKHELEGTFGPLDNMELTLNRPGVATMTVAGLYAFGRIAPEDARSKDLRAFLIRHSDDDDSDEKAAFVLMNTFFGGTGPEGNVRYSELVPNTPDGNYIHCETLPTP